MGKDSWFLSSGFRLVLSPSNLLVIEEKSGSESPGEAGATQPGQPWVASNTCVLEDGKEPSLSQETGVFSHSALREEGVFSKKKKKKKKEQATASVPPLHLLEALSPASWQQAVWGGHRAAGTLRAVSGTLKSFSSTNIYIYIFYYQWGAMTVLGISPQELPNKLIYLFLIQYFSYKINLHSITEHK